MNRATRSSAWCISMVFACVCVCCVVCPGLSFLLLCQFCVHNVWIKWKYIIWYATQYWTVSFSQQCTSISYCRTIKLSFEYFTCKPPTGGRTGLWGDGGWGWRWGWFHCEKLCINHKLVAIMNIGVASQNVLYTSSSLLFVRLLKN